MLRTGSARRLSMTTCAAVVALLTVTTAPAILAQELRGLVMMPDGVTPASGVVVVLLLASRPDSIVARGVTSSRGRFSLKTTPLIPTNLRLLRVGFEPMDGGRIVLAEGEVRDAAFTLHNSRIKLAAVNVKGDARCQVQPDGAQLVAQLFQQARTALISSTTPLDGSISANAVNYTRQQDKRKKLLTPVSQTSYSSSKIQQYFSISVDSLDRVGYLTDVQGNYQFFSPDAQVLLSDRFLLQHCLQLVSGKDTLPNSIGIGFRPVSTRRNRVDVAGTLWLNRATAELQFLEYTYTSLPDPIKNAGLGGRVEYAQIPSGGWFVSNWSIRMPILVSRPQATVSAATVRTPNEAVVAGLQITGGEVQDIRVDDRVMYLNANAAHAGELPGDMDFVKGSAGLGGAEFLVHGDTSTVNGICGQQANARHGGLIAGRVFDDVNKPFAGAFVKAEWRENFRATVDSVTTWDSREVSSTSAVGGTYFLCGIALQRSVSVFARRNGDWGRASLVRISDQAPSAQLDLTLPPLVQKDNESLRRERR